MRSTAIKTKKITRDDSLTVILDTYLPEITERSVIAISSKIVSVMEGNIVPNDGPSAKDNLINNEADHYVSRATKTYDVKLTITRNTLIANAGVDQSNGNGSLIPWPDDPIKSATAIWTYLNDTRHITNLGIIITDSAIVPLRWGTRGIGIGWCGFEPLTSYIGKPDIYDRPLQFTQISVLDGLAATAVYAMGEGAEQTPIVIIEDPPHITYQDRPPTEDEIKKLHISLEDDLFAPLLTSVSWKKRD